MLKDVIRKPHVRRRLETNLLAGLIVADFEQPGDVAAAKRLDVSGDLVQRQHHVLETAYDSLAPSPQALLGRIACFRSDEAATRVERASEVAEHREQVANVDVVIAETGRLSLDISIRSNEGKGSRSGEV